MFNTIPKNLSTIQDYVPEEVIQLCTFDGTWENQVEKIIVVGNGLMLRYPDINLFISANSHTNRDSFAALEIQDSHLKDYPEIEEDVDNLVKTVIKK